MKRMLRYLPRILAVLIVLVVVVYGAFVLSASPAPEHAFFRPDDGILVMAHQGGDGERPSNTMMAFEYAVNLGVDVLELDVHTSSDGEIVIIHDDTVDRTTDGSGRVNDMTLAELKALDAGYHWPTLAEESHRTDRPYRGQGATIATLREVIEAFPDMRLNIEIKQRTPSMVQPLCDMLREYDIAEQVIVVSFHPQPLYDFRQVCPEVATGGTSEEIQTFYFLSLAGLTPAYHANAHAFQVPEYSGDIHVVTQGFIHAAQSRNIDVHPWTINDVETMQRMIDLGVQGIITDYPAQLMTLLGRETGVVAAE